MGSAAPGGYRAAPLSLAARTDAPRYARAHTRDMCRRWGVPQAVAQDAELVVSELVTNACVHPVAPAAPDALVASAAPQAVVELVLVLEPMCLRVSVWDADPRPPVQAQPEAEALEGRGLGIVQELTGGDYAWRHERGGKAVWGALRWGAPPAAMPLARPA